MPEYVLQDKAAPSFNLLDSFTRAYIEAMFWTSEAPGVTTEEWQATEDHNEGSIPGDVGFCDLAPETLERIKADCERFQHEQGALLERAYMRDGYGDDQAGHDFWLTRNGHGVGFWDRGMGELGDELSAACGHGTTFPGFDVYLGDDGKVYGM